ncbi:MAG: molecular chaperone TorD family protein [Propionibacteriaceae bacterium]|nr:molecular chaperone TorD family protein [Propionibacteriaceae bacterium]
MAACGYAVSRLLLVPPDLAVLERFGDPSARASWPLCDRVSVVALQALGAGVDPDRTRAEWEQLFGSAPEPIELTESGWLGEPAAELRKALAARYRAAGLGDERFHDAPADHLGQELRYLAHLVAESARPGAGPGLGAEIAAFRRAHPDRFSGDVLAELGRRAQEPLWRALPGLVEGFLDQVATPAP